MDWLKQMKDFNIILRVWKRNLWNQVEDERRRMWQKIQIDLWNKRKWYESEVYLKERKRLVRKCWRRLLVGSINVVVVQRRLVSFFMKVLLHCLIIYWRTVVAIHVRIWMEVDGKQAVSTTMKQRMWVVCSFISLTIVTEVMLVVLVMLR